MATESIYQLEKKNLFRRMFKSILWIGSCVLALAYHLFGDENATFLGFTFIVLGIPLTSKKLIEKHYKMVANLAALLFLSCFFMVALFTFGIKSDILFFLLIVPIFANLFLDKKEVVFWSMATIASIATIHQLTDLGLLPEPFVKGSEATIEYAFTSIASVILIGFMSYYSKLHTTMLVNNLKKSQHELIDSHNRYEYVIKGAGVGIFDWIDMSKDHIYWSPQLYEILGYEPGEVESSASLFESWVNQDDLAESNVNTAEQLSKGNSFTNEYRIKNKSGEWMWLKTTGYVIKNEQGLPYRMVGAVHDINQQIQANEKLEESRMHAAHTAKLAGIGEMAGGLAHEINNPLSIIQGYSSNIKLIIAKNDVDKEKITYYTEKINSTVMRISKIVKGLLNFSRNTKTEKEVINSKELIDEVLGFCAEKARSMGIVLKLNVNGEVDVMTNRTQFGQVLLNLLNNAFQAIEGTESPWVKLRVYTENNNYVVRVTDSGLGIDDSVLEKIMQPFFTTKEIGVGTGLGLSISKNIVEGLDGELYYDKQSKNTTFVIILKDAVAEDQAIKIAA